MKNQSMRRYVVERKIVPQNFHIYFNFFGHESLQNRSREPFDSWSENNIWFGKYDFIARPRLADGNFNFSCFSSMCVMFYFCLRFLYVRVVSFCSYHVTNLCVCVLFVLQVSTSILPKITSGQPVSIVAMLYVHVW